MKLLFDQNISPKLVDTLADLFPDSIHVKETELDKALDIDIWNFAKNNDYIIISKDADFAERSLLFGYPPFVLWIRRGNCSTGDIIRILKQNFDLIKSFVEAKQSGLLNIY
jgi:predicted nuclease of predicted toxin-antitoxin system